jgi:GTP cyclohydrolase II
MKTIVKEATCLLPTKFGDFAAHIYRENTNQTEHVALVMGDITEQNDVLTRLHSECLTGDVFGSQRCDCGEQLALAQQRISEAGRGLILYLRNHEGRGIGLTNKILAYSMQETGLDTVDANIALGLPVDQRSYYIAAEIIKDLQVSSVTLMSNNPKKHQDLLLHGIDVVNTHPLTIKPNLHNLGYLTTKQNRMGHLFSPVYHNIRKAD